MNAKIDLKSVLCGLAVGVSAMFVVGATDFSSTPVQRYQVAGNAGFFVIVDTATGKAWGANLATPAPGFQTIHTGFWDKKPE